VVLTVQVCVTYEGPVTLSAPQLLALVRYQTTLNNTINWSNKASAQRSTAACRICSTNWLAL
jgi:hypothetical protein